MEYEHNDALIEVLTSCFSVAEKRLLEDQGTRAEQSWKWILRAVMHQR